MKIRSKKLFIYLIFFCFFFIIEGNSKEVPSSFADLAEKLMPSVVNISTTQTITTTSNPFPFEFPPGSPFEELFKDFQGSPTERQISSLGSGFIIDKEGIIQYANNEIDTEWMIYVLEELINDAPMVQGDINVDGIVNILDIIYLVNFILNNQTPTEIQFSASDLNADGMLNILDIVQLVNIIL